MSNPRLGGVGNGRVIGATNIEYLLSTVMHDLVLSNHSLLGRCHYHHFTDSNCK